jgi:hypothetical protein
VNDPAVVVLVAAAGLHLGFQLVVTFLVYPAFAEVPAEDWTRYHDAHSRRITWIVGVVYAALVLASGWVLWAGPRGAAPVSAVAASAVAVLLTATAAAPAHRRLHLYRRARDLRRLVLSDRLRTTAALVALVAALVAATRGPY